TTPVKKVTQDSPPGTRLMAWICEMSASRDTPSAPVRPAIVKSSGDDLCPASIFRTVSTDKPARRAKASWLKPTASLALLSSCARRRPRSCSPVVAGRRVTVQLYRYHCTVPSVPDDRYTP